MSEPFQPHPRFAVPVLEAEIERLRAELNGAYTQIMYLTATIHHLQAEHEATVASLQAAQRPAEEQPTEQDGLGGGAG